MKSTLKKSFFRGGTSIISVGGGAPGREDDTLENFAHAISIGADVLRTNVIVGNDACLSCVSDSFLRRSGTQLSASRHTERSRLIELHELTSASTSIAERDDLFPDLRRVLEAFPDQRFNIHIFEKPGTGLEAICSVVEKTASIDRVLISAVKGSSASYVRKRLPNAASAMSLSGLIWFYGLFRSGLMPLVRRFSADAILMPERIGNSLFGSAIFLEQAKEKKLDVFLYVDEGPEQLKRLIAAGARGFITADVEQTMRAIENIESDE